MLTLNESDLPECLRNIPHAPRRLFVEGTTFDSLLERPLIAIVGSRKLSSYGRSVTEQIATALVRSGAVIVSGLAIGVDSIAQRAAVDAGGQTIAVLPGPIDQIYPSSHTQLARQIVEQGGALCSEYEPGSGRPRKHQFIDRNRIISGLSVALVITEARAESGSLHTARFAAEQGRPVYAVPGQITYPGCDGSNQLLADGHAQLITSPEALVASLGLGQSRQTTLLVGDTPLETTILELLQDGVSAADELLVAANCPVAEFDHAMTMLEINGHIKNIGNGHWRLV